MFSGKRNGRGSKSVFTLITVIGIIMCIIFLFRNIVKKPVISPLSEEQKHVTNAKNILTRVASKKNPDTLKTKVKEVIGSSWNNYSILVVDTASDFTMEINDEEIFTAASVNKIPILAALYTQVQAGKINLDTVITLQQEDVQDYGTGSIRYAEPGTTYSIKTLAKLMMQQSDNTAAYILANHVIGMDVIQSLLTSWNMMQTDMVNNKTSNADMAMLMKKIYQGNIANTALTKEMLSFFKDGEFEDRLPALLPKDAVVYHKTGNGIGVVHDIGIVIGPTTKYYIGIMTSDITDETAAVALMAKISKTIYDFMD